MRGQRDTGSIQRDNTILWYKQKQTIEPNHTINTGKNQEKEKNQTLKLKVMCSTYEVIADSPYLTLLLLIVTYADYIVTYTDYIQSE